MKKFGLELRKANTLGNLYKDVDMVLSKNNLINDPVSDQLKIETTAHALQKMFKTGSFFDICIVRELRDLTQVHIPLERMKLYHSIHCMSWSEMTPEYRETIIAMVLDDFRSVLHYNEIQELG